MEGNNFRGFNNDAKDFTVSEDQQFSAQKDFTDNTSSFDQMVATMSLDGVLHAHDSEPSSVKRVAIESNEGYKKWWQLFILIPIAVVCSLSIMIVIAVISGFLFSGKSVFDWENWIRLFTG